MRTILPIRQEHATDNIKQLLSALPPEVNTSLNLILTLAHSSCALDAFLQLRRAIGAAMLGPRLREQVALAVAEAQQCQYGVCSHTEAARQLGLTEEEIALSREARSRDQRMRAALRFARDLVAHSDVSLAELRQAGYEDSAILELIAIIAFERFANDVALIAQTTIDGPLTARAVSAA